jgi:hypothetical protein
MGPGALGRRFHGLNGKDQRDAQRQQQPEAAIREFYNLAQLVQ